MMSKAAALFFAILIGLIAHTASAQVQTCPSNPGLQCPIFTYGSTPIPGPGNSYFTPAQWNTWFASKQTVLGYTPVNRGGDTMTGELNFVASAPVSAGLNLGQGSAPTLPVNGDLWMTSSGVFARVNGSTVGPFVSGATSPVTSVFSRTGAVIAQTGDYNFAQISSGTTSATATGLTLSGGTLTGASTLFGVSVSAATGTGNLVFSTSPTISAPTISGHPTVEGVTSTGGTGTGNFVFSSSPSISGVLTTTGGRVRHITNVNSGSTYTALTSDDVILVNDTTALAITFESSPTTGQTHCIKDSGGNAAADNITLKGAAGNIDGAPQLTMSVNYEALCVVYSGTQWNAM